MISKRFKVTRFFEISSKLAQKLAKSPKIQQAADVLFECWQGEGVVFVMGCGGSASTASHFAGDLAKTTIVEGKKRFKSVSLVDTTPLVSAWTNDYGWGSVFAEQLEPWLTDKDVLVGFSVHGGSQEEEKSWSQNLTAAMKLAKKRGSQVIGICGFDGGAMAKLADVNILVPIKTEPYGTPTVESVSVLVHHALIFDLIERIKRC